MPDVDRSRTLWQSLFVVLLGITIMLGWQMFPNLKIDTNLAEVSPRTKNSPQTQLAIKQLQSSVEQRVILLVQGADEEPVFEAGQRFRAELELLDGITVMPGDDELAEQLITTLADYRFSLLTDAQQLELSENTAAEISREAHQDLYSTSGKGRLFAFNKDPLGWHSETFSSLLDASQTGMANQQPNQGYAVGIPLNIDRGAMNMRAQEFITDQIDRLVGLLEEDYAIKVERSGVFFFAADAAKNAKQDVSLISVGSTIGVVMLLLFAFGTLRTLVLPLFSILLGVSFAFVVTHSFYGQVHVLTIVFGASLIGIVIDYSLHYFYHQPSRDQILPGSTNKALQRALTFSLMTSLIGYAALSFSDLAALQKVAVFSCCGLLMAWLSVVCLGELATRKPIRINQTVFPGLVTGLSRVLTRVAAKVWMLFAIGLILSAGMIVKLGAPFSDDPRVFFKPSETLLDSERTVAAFVNDYEPGRYIIVNGAGTSQVYARHRAMMDSVTQTSQFNPADLSSLLSWIPSVSQQTANYQQQGTLYAEDGAAQLLSQKVSGTINPVNMVQAEYQQSAKLRLTPDTVVELLGDALPPFWVRTTDQNGVSNIVNFVLIRKGVNADALESALQGLDGVEYVNTLERTRIALAEQRESANRLLLTAYLLIGLLVLLRYRRLTSLWLVAVPVCASAALICVFKVSGISLNLFHTMAFFLVLGFGMDYSIFTKEMSAQSKAKRALTLQAILLSALTSMLSFGLLSISSIPVVASFGLTLLIGNFFNLVGVFVAAQMLPEHRQFIHR